VCPNDAVYVTDKAHIDLMLCDACLKCVSSCGNKAVEFGKEIDIKCRDVDIKNAEKLSSLEGITVLDSPSQLVKLFVRKK
jgi:dihydromethanopterin reductase (acceptor)